MIKFSDKVLEARSVEFIIPKDQMELYIEKVKLPKEIKIVVDFLNHNNILDKETVDKIVDGNKSQIVALSKVINIDALKLIDIQKLIKAKPENLRLIPTFQSEEEIEDLIAGRKTPEDVTLDLETERGRARISKDYMNLVMRIASKYRGSGLDWNGIVSAGMLGLVNAMKDYRRPDYYEQIDDKDKEETKKQKRLSFKQYAGWRIKQQILNDINEYSRTIRLTQHQYLKNKKEGNTKGNFNTISYDTLLGDDGDNGPRIDRMMAGAEYQNDEFVSDNETLNELKILLTKKFSSRDCTIFWKRFGLFGYDQEKLSTIAKEFNLTVANVSMLIKKIITYLQTTPKAKSILQDLYRLSFESLMAKNYNKSKDEMIDILVSDDVHMMLEALVQFDNKTEFNNRIGSALENYNTETREYLLQCLENDFEFIDESYNDKKSVIIDFLGNVFPTETFKKRTDIDILNKMMNISDKFKEHNL